MILPFGKNWRNCWLEDFVGRQGQAPKSQECDRKRRLTHAPYKDLNASLVAKP